MYRREFLVFFFLIAVTFGIYAQILDHDFLNLDDDQYITKNPMVQTGLTKESISWAFSFNRVSYWHPLTWLTHMADCQLFGLAPAGHHLTSLLLHIANALLLFIAFRQMTGDLWRSAMVAALFALHPLNIESVAWAAERKTVLSAFFLMFTLLSYGFYVKKPGLPRYLMVFFCFALGLMAKPSIVALPFMLLLLDFWPLDRLYKGLNAFKTLLSLFLEKMPLLALSLGSIIISTLSSRDLGILISTETLGGGIRLKNALISYLIYLRKAIWPQDLAFFYPFPGEIPLWHAMVSGLLLVCITLWAVKVFRRRPWFLMGWLWYMGTLFPVIGLMQQGLWPAMADRFTYIPKIGLFLVLIWGFKDVMDRWRLPKVLTYIASFIFIGSFSLGTFVYATSWKNSVSLYKHALGVTKRNHLAHFNLGAALQEQGRIEEAISHYEKAVMIMPENARFYYNLASALLEQGKMEMAIKHFSEALRLFPGYPEALMNMGVAQARMERYEEAILYYGKAIEINPNAEAHHNMGLALAGLRRHQEAISHYLEALKIRPDYAMVHNELGVAFFHLGKNQNAIHHFMEALRINPNLPHVRRNLDLILKSEGNRP